MMTKRLWILIPLAALLLSSCIVWDDGPGRPYPRSTPYDDRGYGPPRDVSYFYEYLAPYGSWISMRPFGYVWIPRHMGYRWRPYADGRWVWTDYGWTWISEYDWGWIPFHYGRWGWDDDLGWFWVPDTVWGPAWVSWRTSGLYFGWAPIAPGVDFDVRLGLRRMPVEVPWNFWIFVEGRDFLETRLGGRLIPPERNQTLLRNTIFRVSLINRNSRVFNEGPDLNLVRQTTLRQVERHVIVDSRQAGPDQVGGGQVRIFRPEVRKLDTVRPKESVDYGEARRTLGDAKIYEPPDRRTDAGGGLDGVLQRHKEELVVLDRSQNGELRDLQQRFADRERRLRDAAEKDKLHRELESTLADLKSKHAQEKQALTERQKKDEASVRGRIRK